MRETELESARHDTVVARNEQIIAAPVGDELAMMDVESGSYYLLDDLAGFVWSALIARLAHEVPVYAVGASDDIGALPGLVDSLLGETLRWVGDPPPVGADLPR